MSSTLSPELRRARLAVIGVFVVHASVFGSWAPRVPAIKDRLGLSAGQLGVALLGFAAAQFFGTRLAGPAIGRFGSGRSVRATMPVLCVALVGPALAGDLPGLAVALVAMGIVGGFLDVAMNAQAVAVERAYGRPIMAGLHGAWSIGMLLSGALGTAAAALGAGTRLHFGLVALTLVLASPVLQRGLLGPGDEGRSPVRLAGGPRRGALASGVVLLLGAVAFSSFTCEGAAADWSAVYLHERLHAGSGLAGAAFVAFAIGMSATRLVSDRLALWLGPVRLVRFGGALAAAGLGLGLAVPSRMVGLVAFALFGIGLAPVVPAVFSAAGRLGLAGIGGALGWVVTIGYLGSILGPAAIGFAAQHSGLRAALLLPVLLAVLIAVLAGRIRVAAVQQPPGEAEQLP